MLKTLAPWTRGSKLAPVLVAMLTALTAVISAAGPPVLLASFVAAVRTGPGVLAALGVVTAGSALCIFLEGAAGSVRGAGLAALLFVLGTAALALAWRGRDAPAGERTRGLWLCSALLGLIVLRTLVSLGLAVRLSPVPDRLYLMTEGRWQAPLVMAGLGLALLFAARRTVRVAGATLGLLAAAHGLLGSSFFRARFTSDPFLEAPAARWHDVSPEGLHELELPERWTVLRLSPSGRRFAVLAPLPGAREVGWACRWGASAGGPLHELEGVTDLIFADDQRVLAVVAREDGSVLQLLDLGAPQVPRWETPLPPDGTPQLNLDARSGRWSVLVNSIDQQESVRLSGTLEGVAGPPSRWSVPQDDDDERLTLLTAAPEGDAALLVSGLGIAPFRSLGGIADLVMAYMYVPGWNMRSELAVIHPQQDARHLLTAASQMLCRPPPMGDRRFLCWTQGHETTRLLAVQPASGQVQAVLRLDKWLYAPARRGSVLAGLLSTPTDAEPRGVLIDVGSAAAYRLPAIPGLALATPPALADDVVGWLSATQVGTRVLLFRLPGELAAGVMDTPF